MNPLASDHPVLSPFLSVSAAANMSGILSRHSPGLRCHATITKRDSTFPTVCLCGILHSSLTPFPAACVIIREGATGLPASPLSLVMYHLFLGQSLDSFSSLIICLTAHDLVDVLLATALRFLTYFCICGRTME